MAKLGWKDTQLAALQERSLATQLLRVRICFSQPQPWCSDTTTTLSTDPVLKEAISTLNDLLYK